MAEHMQIFHVYSPKFKPQHCRSPHRPNFHPYYQEGLCSKHCQVWPL